MAQTKTKLPPIFERYLKSLNPRLKRSTRYSHKHILHSFLRWLDEQGVPIKKVGREQTLGWFNHLWEKGLKPSSRDKYATCLRIYLRWLYEHGILDKQPDSLVKTSDFPKTPDYLPRPLSPQADQELQDRLGKSDCLFQQGLLLMRCTGVRIGELMSLDQDCIRCDYQGTKFLKVPLGKLDNERLVPLDHDTSQLVKKLQRTNDHHHKIWLLQTKRGKKTRYHQYVEAMKIACQGLEIDGTMTTHRLRHSYATSLLNAGMSLTSVMKLLGHRDIKMTMRYTAIAQETVKTEYFQALEHIQSKYQLAPITPDLLADPIQSLADVERWIRCQTIPKFSDKQAAIAIAKRIARIQAAMKNLFPHLEEPSD